MTKKSEIRLLFFSTLMLVAIVVIFAFLVLSEGNVPPPDEISESITVTATVDTQVHFTRTVSEGLGISEQ